MAISRISNNQFSGSLTSSVSKMVSLQYLYVNILAVISFLIDLACGCDSLLFPSRDMSISSHHSYIDKNMFSEAIPPLDMLTVCKYM